MWTYILGPFLALLPKPWRDALSFTRYADATRATVLSGLGESAGAIVALGYWYMYIVPTLINRGMDSALAGKVGVVTDLDVGSIAFSVYLSHPITWLLAYFIVEGAVRLCGAAFTENILGTLPLFLFDKIFIDPFRHSTRNRPAEYNLRTASASFLESIRERVQTARLTQVQDELAFRKSGTEELLEVFASRRKDDWNPPRVVRYENNYYRLESAYVGAAPRPFRYALRRLSAGVAGRSVLLYSPTDALIRE